MIYERLELDRPYHTPLFEPHMKPIRDVFVDVQFNTPHYPVYSCATAKPFPADLDEMCSTSVDHWVSTVEFVKLIHRMYDDGARVFLEVGPRGNLTSFIEDTLRGTPMVAVPMNVPRVSCLTQLHHALARLIVHGVPVVLDQYYANRQLGKTKSDSPAENPGIEKPTAVPPAIATPPALHVSASSAASSAVASSTTGGVVMQQYQSVMQQFLEVQRGVMRDFLAGSNGRRRGMRPVSYTHLTLPTTPYV